MGTPYLQIENLTINYNTSGQKKHVLSIENLCIEKGQALGLIGESGTGKTVLAQAILQLLEVPPGEYASGKILLDGEDVLQKTGKEMATEIRGKKVAMIFQDPMSTLNPVYSIGQQMINVIMQNQGLSKHEARNKALEMLDLVKLPDVQSVMDKYPHELSGGQRQRVIIALALSCGSEFIIADEPTRNLDVTIQAGILKLLKELQARLNVTLLFIANNPGLIYATCDHVAILQNGYVVEQGTTHEVLKEGKHPYTDVLLNAIPKDKSFRPRTIDILEGENPSPCHYYPWCALRCEACMQEPHMIHVGGEHYVRCNLAKEAGR